MRSSHSLDRLDTAFDDDRLVAGAGLLLPATLAAHLGLKDLVDEHLNLGDRPGRANAGDKLLTLVMSALAGGDCIDDADALRAGGTAGSSVTRSRRRPPSARSCAASAGATSASSTGSAGCSSPGPGRRVPDRAVSPSRSISTRRSARRMAWPRRAPSTTGTPGSGAITPCSRSRPGRATSSWPACARVVPTPSGARPTS